MVLRSASFALGQLLSLVFRFASLLRVVSRSVDCDDCHTVCPGILLCDCRCSYGGYCLDTPSVSNLWNAGAAHVDVYAFPCAGQDPAAQVNQLVSNLANDGVQYGMIWADIETKCVRITSALCHSSFCWWDAYVSAHRVRFPALAFPPIFELQPV